MNIRRFGIFIFVCIVLASYCMSDSAKGMSSSDSLDLVTRSRTPPLPDDASRFKVVQKKIEWDPKQTAIIICDMWNEHWCKGASKRTAELAPYMNDVVSKARDEGVFIIHAPSGTVKSYTGHPARKRAEEAPKAANLPDGIDKWCRWIDEKEEKIGYPIDHSDGGCDCLPTCKQGPPWPWKSQIDTIQISDEDAISDSGVEVWNLLEQRGITNVILMGVHTNMCVLGRPFGLRHMAKFGKNVVLMRDLTDTMYNSRMRPFVNHFTGTDLVVEHVEKYVCSTITSTAFTGRPAFRFTNDNRPRVVFLSAESEYSAVEILPEFAHELQIKYGLSCEILQGSPEKQSEDRHELAGLEALTNADLVVVFMRRRALHPDQMKYFRDYVAAGKPLIALRTASHAFDARGSAPKGYAEWPTFDPEVLGGNYHGHHGSGPTCTVTLAANAEGHPILAGVKLPFISEGSLYKVRPLAESTTQLLIGTIPDKEPEPVAWTHRVGQSRVFSTSLGHPDDFKNASFRQTLINAVFWAMNKPVPKPE
ncbi:MAG: ThuA domain-containing protein [Sedimentisphaerales bacterium]|nr:ThuA domain-containing protein [Sedimentisphaerales bacterium]